MKQICVISGKGGTGKSSLTASLAMASHYPIIIADCDVDGANTALFFDGTDNIQESFQAGTRAVISNDSCTRCNRCVEVCRYHAITYDFKKININTLWCEGCHACAMVCSTEAIHFQENTSGQIYHRETCAGPLVHAALYPGQDNSGKLVSKVREKAVSIAQQKKVPLVLIDGPPGIGCPVHATLTGVDTALIVTEPSVSGIHDFKRISQLCMHFGISKKVIINKFDSNLCQTEHIEQLCAIDNSAVIGKIPFDKQIPFAQCEEKTLYQMDAHRDIITEIAEQLFV